MNQTLKEATIRGYHYDSHRQLGEHLDAYNFAKRLKALGGHTLTSISATVGQTNQPASDTIQFSLRD
jgi:hypothetical protein